MKLAASRSPATQSSMIAFHTFIGSISLVTGLLMIALKKGTLLHRRVGWILAVTLILLLDVPFLIGSLLIPRQVKRFKPRFEPLAPTATHLIEG
ncbi:MAG: hypothetical protein HY231_23435 [Acidobacteria bacterium]|nr:hypothetical protein [Acidobacteriota bacterium]